MWVGKVSFIPSNAVGSLIGVSARETQESIRARNIQSQKALRHSEEVEDLDENTVDQIGDQPEHRNSQEEEQKKRQSKEDAPTERVEITALQDTPPAPPTKRTIPAPSPPRLDISA